MQNSLSFKLKQSITLKLFILGIIAFVLLIPAEMIKNTINEREERRNEVVAEISSKWGNQQVVRGPVMTIPYLRFYKSGNEELSMKEYLHILPEELNVTGSIDPEIRYRGMYKVVTYHALTEFSGFFSAPDLIKLGIGRENLLMNEVFISIGISDMKGINKPVDIEFDSKTNHSDPGTALPEMLSFGISSPVEFKELSRHSFKFNIDLNGSESFRIMPVGKTTSFNLKSEWANPSFEGDILPDERQVTDKGFEANWQILDLNRNYPQQWTGNNSVFNNAGIGVSLLFPVDIYQKSERSVKYAIMFLALTFVTFFFSEVLNKKRIHPVNYLLVGAALCLFYALLISMAEQVGFGLAYFIASGATISLISIFTGSIFNNFKIGVLVLICLIILYSFLYIILQLQDYSLLMGSIGLFIILAILMYFSRRISWENTSTSDEIKNNNI
jgi:inner membrane protein